VDLDVEEPNSGLFLEKRPVFSQVMVREVPSWDSKKCSFCGNCLEVCNFNAIAQLPEQILIFPELCHSCSACVDLCPNNALTPVKKMIGSLVHFRSGRLNLIESRLEIGEPSGVPLIRQTKESVAVRFNNEAVHFFDCPPGNSCPLIECVKDVDFVIIVSEPTPFGLHDLQITIETMKKLGLNFGIVINKSFSSSDPVMDYCLKNDVDILGTIKHMKSFAEVGAVGELLVKRFPSFRNSVESVLEKVQNSMKYPTVSS